MRRNFFFSGFLLITVLLIALPGSSQSASGFLDDLDPNLRAAASSVLSTQWAISEGSDAEASDATLFGVFDSGTPEGRATGALAQRTRMVVGSGDPALGEFDAQTYADAALIATTPELAYVRASAAFFAARNGFASVPGGPPEAFKRIQSCLLDGNIQTNQDNLVDGVAFDCSNANVRLALADTIASGWYAAFHNLAGFSCDDIGAQATGGPNVASRWAAANAWLLTCGGDAAEAAKSGTSAELRAADVAPLAGQLAAGGDAAALLAAANGSGSDEYRTANALAAGLVIEATEEITISSLGSPTTASLGNLFSYSLGNGGLPTGGAAVAPLARYLAGGSDALTITVFSFVPGSSRALTSSLVTLN